MINPRAANSVRLNFLPMNCPPDVDLSKWPSLGKMGGADMRGPDYNHTQCTVDAWRGVIVENTHTRVT